MTAAPRARLLVVAPRYRYMNPTGEAFMEGLASRFDVVFHGPGYIPLDTLEPDLRRVWERSGPFDAVLLHQYFLFSSLAEAAASMHADFPVTRFLRDFPDFPRGLGELPAAKFAVMLVLDPYALGRRHLDAMGAFPGIFVSWPTSFVDPSADYFGVADAITRPTTAYRDFFTARPDLLVPFHHILRDDEFDWTPWAERRWDAAVPGVAYARRRQAVASLRGRGLAVAPKPLMLRLARYAYAGRPYRHLSGIGLMNRAYRQQIRSSRVCFAEGSGFNMPVRKYLEIPAYGSLLAAIPCNGARDMGFVDGETYVETTERDLPDAVRELAADPARAERIIGAAQRMLRARHTQSARADQFAHCLERIRAGTYLGARWTDGRFELMAGS